MTINPTTGKPNTDCHENLLNAIGRSDTERPSVNARAVPLAMLISPSVATNEGTWPKATRPPLSRPENPPTAVPSTTATGWDAPAVTSKPKLTAESARTEPTDRSMCPDRITNVIPMATIAKGEDCESKLERLAQVRNTGLENPKIIKRA